MRRRRGSLLDSPIPSGTMCHASRYENIRSHQQSEQILQQFLQRQHLLCSLVSPENEESLSRAKLINIVAGSFTDQHPGRSARMLEKRAAMASLVKKYKQVDFNNELNSAMAV